MDVVETGQLNKRQTTESRHRRASSSSTQSCRRKLQKPGPRSQDSVDERSRRQSLPIHRGVHETEEDRPETREITMQRDSNVDISIEESQQRESRVDDNGVAVRDADTRQDESGTGGGNTSVWWKWMTRIAWRIRDRLLEDQRASIRNSQVHSDPSPR